ncbi:hypothetical protein OS493_030730 [Desmophyllum pertusum]|uniref:Uncharacterized protein n=1 Tax=Desmophyllum pertusum TaxID=174260 RepID=A0A9W9Z948_9CNID|nr:hypothetical protein OS493_030730 [Desmophyllum pertusum]
MRVELALMLLCCLVASLVVLADETDFDDKAEDETWLVVSIHIRYKHCTGSKNILNDWSSVYQGKGRSRGRRNIQNELGHGWKRKQLLAKGRKRELGHGKQLLMKEAKEVELGHGKQLLMKPEKPGLGSRNDEIHIVKAFLILTRPGLLGLQQDGLQNHDTIV